MLYCEVIEMAEIEVKDCGDGVIVLGFPISESSGFRYFITKKEKDVLIDKLMRV